MLVAVARAGGCSCDQAKVEGKPKGSACEKAADCSGNLVCSPDTKTCDAVGCTTNTECGVGAQCSNGNCIDNVDGGACDSDTNCIDGEHCRGDTCHPQGSAGDACTTTEQCALPLVCDPGSSQCATTVACTGNADCGTAAFCNNSTCAPASGETPCSSDANCASGDKCLGVVCVPAQCQGEAFQAEVVKPNMMIVFDRSGSMKDNLNHDDGRKIDVATAAVTALVNAHGNDIRFGFAPFPSAEQVCNQNESCAQGFVAVDVGDNSAQPIVDFMAGMNTCQGTPTGDQIHLMDSYAPLQDGSRNNFILLITDGAANCGADTPTEIGDLLAGQGGQFPAVKTFVIGFGSGVDAGQLTDMSNAGGEAQPGHPNYFQADSAASLDT
ncbi:MAG TPA: vWA domain-containing protein, partial [Myxococcota bacterium]